MLFGIWIYRLKGGVQVYFKVKRDFCTFYSEGFKDTFNCEFEVEFDFIGAEMYGEKKAKGVFNAMHEVLLREKTELYHTKLISDFPLTPMRSCILVESKQKRNDVKCYKLIISDFK